MNPVGRISPVKWQNERGLTVLEVVVALVVLGIVIAAGMALMQTTLAPMKSISQNIFNSLGSDISVRGFDYQFGNSEIMRLEADGSPLVGCRGKTLLPAGRAAQEHVLEALGDRLTFAFAQRRTLGVPGAEAGTLTVPDPSMFRPGLLVMASTLDAAKDAGLFKVESVGSGGVLKLTDALQDPPAEFDCTLSKSARGSVLLNPSNPRKLSVSVVSLIQYVVEPLPGVKNAKRLAFRQWPIGGAATGVDRGEVITRFQKMVLKETFTPVAGSSAKGSYRATMTLDFLNIDVSKALTSSDATRAAQLVYSAGYSLGGIEIANEAAVPLPPNLENVYVTCMLTAAPRLTNFADAAGKIVPVYVIDGFYSEAESVNGPVFSMALTSSGTPPRCWRVAKNLHEITYPAPLQPLALPRLEGAGSPNVVFDKAASATSPAPDLFDFSEALLQPVVCSVPSEAQATSTLQYYDVTSTAPRTVTCSKLVLHGLKKTWTYDGASSSCSKDGGIFIGRLVNVDDPAESGPVLKVKAGSCDWEGSPSSSCNPAEVLGDDADAELKSVQLIPDDLTIKNLPSGTALICH